ncbi:hypothetical protein SteCoe_18104 [Stentor coeruleus]|uniref:RING-type domain-containing protein n=1 Tax=Stentor coeruleus TaxID=5963 RepID=A0A1R2BXA3_9CILI|nr:hypothetical protein SteCoe_18104 [Stentor coeruleus]
MHAYEDYCCVLCGLPFDPENLRPLRLPCNHIYCEICAGNFLVENTYTCPQKDWVTSEPYHEFKNRLIALDIIEKTNIFRLKCWKHDEFTFYFNSDFLLPVCKNCTIKSNYDYYKAHNFIEELFIITYYKLKKYLSKEIQIEVKNAMMKKKILTEKLYWIQLMNLYIKNSYVCREHNIEAVAMNILDFSLYCEQCVRENDDLQNLRSSGNEFTVFQSQTYIFFCKNKLNDVLYEFIQKFKFKELLNSSIAKFQSVESSFSLNPLIECLVMRKYYVYSKSRSEIGCQKCRKLYSTNWRLPIKLKCHHLICLNCFNEENTCNFCGLKQELIEIISLIPTYPKCSLCKMFITTYNLPLKSLCSCIKCNYCAKLKEQCDCLQYLPKKNSFIQKINNKSLLAMLKFEIPEFCCICKTKLIEQFSSRNNKFYCTECLNKQSIQGSSFFKLAIESIENVIKCYNLNPRYLIKENLHELSYEETKFSNAERLYRLNDPTIGFEHLKCMLGVIKRFKTIFPVVQEDFRYFDIKYVKEKKLELSLSSNKPIMIVGIIVGGRVDSKECKFLSIIGVNYDEYTIKKEIAQYEKNILVPVVTPKAAIQHTITIIYENDYLLCSGKITKKTIYKGPENLEFKFEGNQISLQGGPILEIIYKY